ALPILVGHVGDGIAVIQHHIQIGQRAQHRAIEQRLAALPASEQGALERGAQHRLGNGVHQRLCSLSSSMDSSSSSSRALRLLRLVLRWAVMFSLVSCAAIAMASLSSASAGTTRSRKPAVTASSGENSSALITERVKALLVRRARASSMPTWCMVMPMAT